MNTDPEQLELLGPDDLDGLSWDEWFRALPLVPESKLWSQRTLDGRLQTKAERVAKRTRRFERRAT